MKRAALSLALLAMMVGTEQADAARWTVPKLVKHAAGKASQCRIAPHWGPKQIQCAALVVNRDKPWLGRESIAISRCETGGTFNEHADENPPYMGLGQFHPRTWATLPRWISRHSPFSPPWAYRGMRYLRLQDGNWHQWPYCSRHAL